MNDEPRRRNEMKEAGFCWAGTMYNYHSKFIIH